MKNKKENELNELKNREFDSIEEFYKYFGIKYNSWYLEYQKSSDGKIRIENDTHRNINRFHVYMKDNETSLSFKWKDGIFDKNGNRLSKEAWNKNKIVLTGAYNYYGLKGTI